MEEKTIETSADLLKELNDIKTDLEKKSKEDANQAVSEVAQAFEEKLTVVTKAIEDLKAVKPEVTAEELKAIKEEVIIQQRVTDRMQVAMKNNVSAGQVKVKTFNELLEETINRNAEAIRSYRKEQGEVGFDMMPEVKAKNNSKGQSEREVKAVGDMSIAANYPGVGAITIDVRGLIESPYNRVWLSDVLPQGTSTGTSILYPKENGGEGGAALWTDPTQDKPQMDFDFTAQSAYFKWIAGIVIIDRGMLDDIDFMTSYIRNRMLISLKIAENDFILNGSSDSNPVTGMLDAATAYDGTETASVDRIIDAAYGQIVEDTFDYYNPTSVILTPRNAVAIALNKATGSGEYNLPVPSAALGTGANLTLGGLQIVRTTSVGSGNFLAFDKNAVMFIKRMQPELRMFEDSVLAKRNKIMFRVEERATLAIFNNNALVTGTLGLTS